jgi:hypothetical protein
MYFPILSFHSFSLYKIHAHIREYRFLASLCSGPLNFDTGVSLKMAVSQLAEWAADAAAAGTASPSSSPIAIATTGATGSSGLLPHSATLPLLRAAADLLMVPKRTLIDPAVRAEVAPGIPAFAVRKLLERYRSSGTAVEGPLPPGLLDELKAAERNGGGAVAQGVVLTRRYGQLPESVLLSEGKFSIFVFCPCIVFCFASRPHYQNDKEAIHLWQN